jgi:pyruvate dehydrogenase E1 component alpha subunit
MPLTDMGRYSISRLQILDEDGIVDPELEPDLSGDDLVRLYRAMVLAREDDQRMLKMQRQGRVGTFGPNTGQEAAVCGPALALTPRDWMVGSFRELGARLMRGEPLTSGYLFHNGFEEGNVFDGMDRTLPISIIVAAQTLHATGIAYALKYRKEKDAAVLAFIGDGGTSQGDFHEALNFASVWQVPVVFVVQNNGWAISLPRHRQAHSATLAQRAIAYDMPGVQVDGNDALATYSAAREALERARSGGGPSLVEAVTYRLMMHTTADDPKKYRTEEEVEQWWKRDPIPRFRKYLESRSIWDDGKQAALEAEVKEEIDAAVRSFESMEGFKPDAPFDHVFGTRHEGIEEQRAAFLASLEAEV